MVAGVLGEKVVGIIVVGRGRVAVPGLELADDELGEVGPVRRRLRFQADIVAQRIVFSEGTGGVEVTRVKVVERGDVGRALNGGVAAPRQNAAAGPADVAWEW